MPIYWESVPPVVFVQHNGVTVWHTYKDDSIDDPLTFWFTTHLNEEDAFDVRGLPQYSPRLSTKSVIMAAIEAGDITVGDTPEGEDENERMNTGSARCARTPVQITNYIYARLAAGESADEILREISSDVVAFVGRPLEPEK